MLDLLQAKLPFNLNEDFLKEQVGNYLNMYLCADKLWLIHDTDKDLLQTAEMTVPDPINYKRFNPPRCELKTKVKDRYPFSGSERSFTLDFAKLARFCSDWQLEQKILLIIDEKAPGNTLINLKVAKQDDWQISCLNLSSNSHCVYLVSDLAQSAHLEVDCLSITNMQSAAELKATLPANFNDGKRLRAEQGFIIYSDVAKDAKFSSTSCNFKASSLNDAVVHLNEDGAEAEAYAAMFVNNQASQSTHLEIRHHAPHTTSFMLCNGVVQAKCTGEFVGRGYIDKASHGTNCRQESRFLTLDKTAKAKTYPLLIIDEYDVIAGHATSVGQLNPDALYYMQSRGLTSDLAKKLMTRGFLIPVVDHFQSQLLQKLGIKLLEWQTNYTANSEEELAEQAEWANLALESNQQAIDIDEDKILSNKDVK